MNQREWQFQATAIKYLRHALPELALVSAIDHATRLEIKRVAQLIELDERFEKYVHPEPNSGCWLWTGATNRGGYGCFIAKDASGKNGPRTATHVSLELHGRPRPAGLHACHKCDNPACVNPDHLFWGTRSENVQDSMAKGRWSKPPPSTFGRGARSHCGRGHAMSGSNLYLTPDGERQCKACKHNKRVAIRAAWKIAGLTSRGITHKQPTYKLPDYVPLALKLRKDGISRAEVSRRTGVTAAAIYYWEKQAEGGLDCPS